MDPLSIATGAKSVAGAGTKLAQSLRNYVETVNKADKWIEALADQVKLTSAVLEDVGVLLRREEIHRLCTADLLASISTAVDGCRGAFPRLQILVEALFEQSKSAQVGLSATARLSSSFSQNELDNLRALLERFRGSLDLAFAVLKLSSSPK